MKKKYLLYIMISCASISQGSRTLQGFSFLNKFKEQVEEKIIQKAQKHSLKRDIVQYWFLWALTPAATLISAFLLTSYDFIGEDQKKYVILKWFGSYLVGSVSFTCLYTCWYHFIAKKEPRISLKKKFLRFFLFISSAAWPPLLIIALDEMKILNFDKDVWYIISSFVVSFSLSLVVLGYSYIEKKISKR